MDLVESAKAGDLQYFKTVYLEVLRYMKDPDGTSVLDWTVCQNRQDCVEEICQRCPELVYNQNSAGTTALHWAVLYGDVPMLAVLLNTAIKVDGRSGRKLTRMLNLEKTSPLLLAVYQNKLEIVKYLLVADPEYVPAPDNYYYTPLSWATEKVTKTADPAVGKIAVLLLEHEKYQRKLGSKEKNWTSLQKAAASGDIEAVKQMMNSSRNEIDLVDGEKRNFVHLTAQFGRTEIMKYLLKEADLPTRVLNAQDKYGNTPLLVAGLFGNISTATCIVYDSRVLKETLNCHGQNFLDVVFTSGRESGREKAKSQTRASAIRGRALIFAFSFLLFLFVQYYLL